MDDQFRMDGSAILIHLDILVNDEFLLDPLSQNIHRMGGIFVHYWLVHKDLGLIWRLVRPFPAVEPATIGSPYLLKAELGARHVGSWVDDTQVHKHALLPTIGRVHSHLELGMVNGNM